MPLLSEVMGRDVRTALIRSAKIDETKDEALRDTLSHMDLNDPQGRIFLPKLRDLSPALQVMVLHDHLKMSGVSDISQDLLSRCCHLIHKAQPSKINLPGGRFLRRKEQRIFIADH